MSFFLGVLGETGGSTEDEDFIDSSFIITSVVVVVVSFRPICKILSKFSLINF